jgi:aspartyl-tRNA(Asn)/glutamyl-tRNA(Gln) amidotransferase subunit A
MSARPVGRGLLEDFDAGDVFATVNDRTSAWQSVQRSLTLIEAHDADLRACILVRGRAAQDEARALDQTPAGSLHGWTIGVKDNMDVAGTVRSDGLGPPHPGSARRDAAAVRRLRAAGAVVVAKTNLEELSLGATSRNRWWGACRNPWDRSRLAGGSSGGSAVAVAAGMVTAALGTDTGGSLRNPAAFCGISALRPTVGLVPMTGVTTLSPDFDVVGAMATSAGDLRALLEVLAARRAPAAPTTGLTAARVGIPEAFFFDDLHADVAAGCEAAARELAAGGADLVPLGLSGAQRTPELLGVLLNAQAAELHPRWLRDSRVTSDIRERLLLGRDVPPRARAAAVRAAERWRRTVAAALEQVDLLLVPTTTMLAPRLGDEPTVALSARINRLNCAWSLARLPVVALPTAIGASRLPVGVQLVGAPGSDWRLLDVAAALQERTDWHRQRPPIGDST